MSNEILNSIDGVRKAMLQLNAAFERRVEELKASGSDAGIIKEVAGAAAAMKDSAGIYLSWANHFAKKAAGKVTEDDELREDADFQDFTR